MSDLSYLFFLVGFVFLTGHFHAHVHIVCRHQSLSASHSLVKINKEESNNKDGDEWKDEEVSYILDVCGEVSVQAKLEET